MVINNPLGKKKICIKISYSKKKKKKEQQVKLKNSKKWVTEHKNRVFTCMEMRPQGIANIKFHSHFKNPGLKIINARSLNSHLVLYISAL